MTESNYIRSIIVAGMLILLPLCNGNGMTPADVPGDSLPFVKGGDVSLIPQIEDLGGQYTVDGQPTDPLQILKDHGFTAIRLKLWHSPEEDYNTLEKVSAMARRIDSLGMQFMLDFHYSDTWADPGKQYKPEAWEGLPFETLVDSVYEYTKRVVRTLYDQGTTPDMVQIGNEIISGMLWDDGRVGGEYDTPAQWENLGDLVNAGIRGVEESCPVGDSVQIVIHIDRGGDNGGSRWFFDNLQAEGVDFDIIGQSFYPWWHGTLDDVRSNLNDLAVRYDKDIMVVETAYPWTLNGADNRGNIVGRANQLHEGYPASVNGQKAFLSDLMDIIRNVKNGRGKGIFYWAPTYISVQPLGSPWENLALFDFQGNALPSLDVFMADTTEPPAPVNVTVRLNTSTLKDTLREKDFVQIRGEVNGISLLTLPDGSEIRWDSSSELLLENAGGDYWEIDFQMYPGDSLSYKFWTGFSRSEGTFQRLGWEGPVTAYGGISGNRRVLVPGVNDTVVSLQYYNSTSEATAQYWRPYESKDDSVALYFRVNMGKAMASGRFDPAVNGPVTVRGDSAESGGSLSWNRSLVELEREQYSVNNESFWSGVGYVPKSAIVTGDTLEYKFYIENGSGTGWEESIANRSVPLAGDLSDSTIHWVYFNERTATRVHEAPVSLPVNLALKNHPNPFNSQTEIHYSLTDSSPVTLNVFNIRGRRITTLVDSPYQQAGEYSVVWHPDRTDGTQIASGLYLLVLYTQEGVRVRKTTLIQ